MNALTSPAIENEEEPDFSDFILEIDPVVEIAPAIVEVTPEIVIDTPVGNPAIFGSIPATQKVEEALEFGGLNYEVETFSLKPVIAGIGTVDSPEPDSDFELVDFVGIRRSDERKTVFAVMGSGYEIVQNEEIFRYLTPLIEESNGTFTRVGTFFDGARVFAFLTLSDKIELAGGVKITQNVVIRSSHDGSRCLSVAVVATLDNGTIVKSHKGFEFKHTKNAKIRVSEVTRLLEIKNKFFGELAETLENLSNQPITDDEADAWIKNFLGFPESNEVKVHAAKLAQRDAILKAFREAVAGKNTKLALGLAIAHYRSQTAPVRETKRFTSETETRFRSVLSGTGARELETAWEALTKLVTV